jgi:hypothetical protein
LLVISKFTLQMKDDSRRGFVTQATGIIYEN